jgi:hypothetical protein
MRGRNARSWCGRFDLFDRVRQRHTGPRDVGISSHAREQMYTDPAHLHQLRLAVLPDERKMNTLRTFLDLALRSSRYRLSMHATIHMCMSIAMVE